MRWQRLVVDCVQQVYQQSSDHFDNLGALEMYVSNIM